MKTPAAVTASARGMRVALVRSAFNAEVVDGLVEGARRALLDMGAAASALTVLEAPGAFELPLLARAAATSRRYDAVVALGAVIKGETDHYESICRAATDGLARVALDTGVPVGFGVLTCRTEEQARARSSRDEHNKGGEAARAAVALARQLAALRPRRPARR
jgi:6,7-dimethyl-8-ribityllumazine synthase